MVRKDERSAKRGLTKVAPRLVEGEGPRNGGKNKKGKKK